MKENAPNKNKSQLLTFKLVAMGCHIQISLNITKLCMRYSQAVIDHQITLLTSDVQPNLVHPNLIAI